MPKMPKESVLYIHKPGDGKYQCRECMMWVKDAWRCTIHGKGDLIKDIASCGFWVHGEPVSIKDPHGKPMAMVNKQQSGYVENDAGYGCRHCEYFDRQAWDCKIVDKNSKGDDPGIIHPMACCNAWKKHPLFGNIE